MKPRRSRRLGSHQRVNYDEEKPQNKITNISLEKQNEDETVIPIEPQIEVHELPKKRKLDETDFPTISQRPKRIRKTILNPNFVTFNESDLDQTQIKKAPVVKKRDDDDDYMYDPNDENEDDFDLPGKKPRRKFPRQFLRDSPFLQKFDQDYVQIEDDNDSDEDEIDIELEEENEDLPPSKILKERKGYSLRDPKPIIKQKKHNYVKKKKKTRYDKLRQQHRDHERKKKKLLNQGNFPLHDTTSSDDDMEDDDDFKKSKTYTRIEPINRNVTSYRMGKRQRADIDPVPIDRSITWDSVGGLKNHIISLKEMVILPLLYNEIYTSLSIKPPRGVLFVGPPGTGKTLVARALCNMCRVDENQEIAFFMRKGADILSKWVGEAEKQLRLLFEKARELQPSIIFFDEIDGLAPVRSSKQDYIHSSIVSTLLALMDGLDDRGQVVVIGATNRVDAVDPALRRPGRFDRELYFGLPNEVERKEILDIHTKSWNPPVKETLKREISKKIVGYCGADIKNLCTETALNSLRRQFPQIYESREKLLIDPSQIVIERPDWFFAVKQIVPTSHKTSFFHPEPLPFFLDPLVRGTLNDIKRIVKKIFPYQKKKISNTSNRVINNVDNLEFNLPIVFRPWILIHGEMGLAQNEIVKALLYEEFDHFSIFNLSISNLLLEPKLTSEEALISMINQAKAMVPSIIVLPNIENWWENSSTLQRSLLVNLLKGFPNTIKILVVITSQIENFTLFPTELRTLFKSNVYKLKKPSFNDRRNMFEILYRSILLPIKKTEKRNFPKLRKAPVIISKEKQKDNEIRTRKQENKTLLELKVILYDIVSKLIKNRHFSIYKSPKESNQSSDEFIDDSITGRKKKTRLLYLYDLLEKVNGIKYTSVELFVKDINTIAQNSVDYESKYSNEIERRMEALGQQLVDQTKMYIDRQISRYLKRECRNITQRRYEFEEKRKNNEKKKKPTNLSPNLSRQSNSPQTTPGGSGLRIVLRPRKPRKKKENVVDIEIDKKKMDIVFKKILRFTENFTVNQVEEFFSKISRIIFDFQKKSERNEILTRIEKLIENNVTPILPQKQ